MTEYAIFFNQQWVGDHSREWFASRAPLAMQAVQEMEAAGVLVFAGGLDEDLAVAFSVDPTRAEPAVTDGPYVETAEWLGGLTIIDVPDLAAARHWAGRIAEACGWPQEVRPFKRRPDLA